jgi:hemerythrin-like domain-containing protein
MALKRSEALQPLSRQHHNGLLFCLLLGKGIKKQSDPEVMGAFIQEFWYKDLQHHFELEEQYLDPLKKRYPGLKTELDRMTQEHYELKNIINEISLNPSLKSIEELENKLNAHIRFEERLLFPFIEQTITEAEKQAIGQILGKERDHNCMNYPVKFWE